MWCYDVPSTCIHDVFGVVVNLILYDICHDEVVAGQDISICIIQHYYASKRTKDVHFSTYIIFLYHYYSDSADFDAVETDVVVAAEIVAAAAELDD